MTDLTTTREFFERLHVQQMAGYAVGEADSGGRTHDESEHPYRTCFQRDRDRIMHCSAFRRLDFKTQVFVPHEDDHFRTRLTHTLEVAQIGRDLGRALRLNEDLIEAVALAHDLGHPPFGHSGEATLAELMVDHGGFEHNRQSLRVVDYLEHPYPQFRGLNLTQAVRECIAKHETRYDHPVTKEFDLRQAAPMEGQLVDLADEIAYTAADLEDALASESVTVEQLAKLELWQRAWDIAEQRCPQARDIHKRIRATKTVIALMADDLLATTLTHVESLRIDSPHAVRDCGHKCVALSTQVREAVDAMQEFLLENVYTQGANAQRSERGGQIIRQLFTAYLSHPELLPERYRKRSHDDGVHRVICDYIAGMTDRFCLQEHGRIAG